jgi:2-iminobutanoate/2-iminopropanoate deaminase
MEKKVIYTPNAPAAIGPYSQGIEAGDFIYVSGCLPIDMATGEISTGDVAEMTRCSMKNVAAILEAAGSDLSKVVKTTIFVKDLKNFGVINAAYAEFFQDAPPARACVQVAALPKDAELEIEAVALK